MLFFSALSGAWISVEGQTMEFSGNTDGRQLLHSPLRSVCAIILRTKSVFWNLAWDETTCLFVCLFFKKLLRWILLLPSKFKTKQNIWLCGWRAKWLNLGSPAFISYLVSTPPFFYSQHKYSLLRLCSLRFCTLQREAFSGKIHSKFPLSSSSHNLSQWNLAQNSNN